jgi:hypothetical protein
MFLIEEKIKRGKEIMRGIRKLFCLGKQSHAESRHAYMYTWSVKVCRTNSQRKIPAPQFSYPSWSACSFFNWAANSIIVGAEEQFHRRNKPSASSRFPRQGKLKGSWAAEASPRGDARGDKSVTTREISAHRGLPGRELLRKLLSGQARVTLGGTRDVK